MRQRIGVVPEDLALFENLTAREHLTFIGRMYLLAPETIRARSDDLLGLLGLEDNKDYVLIRTIQIGLAEFPQATVTPQPSASTSPAASGSPGA